MLANNAQTAFRLPEMAIADLPGLPPSYPVPAVIAEDTRRVFVERGLALRGELSGCDHLAIAGHVESDVALHVLDILDQGSFKGHASVGKAHIAGRYEGALTVEETLVVGSTAHISGSVLCGNLQLEDGGKIDGELRVLADEAKRAQHADDDAAVEAGEAPPAPGPVDAMVASAAAVEECASLAEAEATFRAALEANLCDVAALSGLGHLARQRGDLAGALRYFEQLMAADAENISVRRVCIDILRALSRHDEAAALAKEVRAIGAQSSALAGDAPDDEPAASPGFDEAEAMFKSVLDRHPKNLGALAGLGHLARRRGNREAMHKYYAAALAIEPMNITLRVEVARAFKEQGDVALARQILETVLTERWGSHADAAG
jgi:cytoskeletal protein CcmA (bactofilin family)